LQKSEAYRLSPEYQGAEKAKPILCRLSIYRTTLSEAKTDRLGLGLEVEVGVGVAPCFLVKVTARVCARTIRFPLGWNGEVTARVAGGWRVEPCSVLTSISARISERVYPATARA
jgi:hypothetical protein